MKQGRPPPSRALVLMHVDSLGTLSAHHPAAAQALAVRMIAAVAVHPGHVIVVHQGWNDPVAEDVMEEAMHRGPSATLIEFDEDTSTWPDFLRRLRATLRKLRVKSVDLGGLWWSCTPGQGCARYVYDELVKTMPVRIMPTLIADKNEL